MTTARSVLVPGGRDVRGAIDEPDKADEPDDGGGRIVVACPPHPRHGGRSTDPRLRAVSDRLVEAGVACLRFDYGPWADGEGELADGENAVEWALDGYGRVGLFGYSFGGAIALLAAARTPEVAAVSALAPVARLSPELDVTSTMSSVSCPVQVVYGVRDTTADWQPVVAAARNRGGAVVELSADHHFVGQTDSVADRVGPFLIEHL